MTADRRGFREERGYHAIGDPWKEQRHSCQEEWSTHSAPSAGRRPLG
ncbi:hypothetical protein OG749_41505 [Streptomyces nojiriensis]